MITIRDLKWSNWASYGEDNYINFEQPVLQIVGTNGAGKTSIPIILQELYYGKNSKGKKKTSLANRYMDKPTLLAESNFYDEVGNKYKINLSRKSTLKLHLYKNGEDISSHTTTNTYKTIQGIIGLDFKTFSQLIYQSSTDNLEFLTATDINRKKFLINLFSLNKYLSIQDKFKDASSKLSIELASINSTISTITTWVDQHSNTDLTEKVIQELPLIDEQEIDALAKIKIDLSNITTTNKKINTNNQFKELLEGLDTGILFYDGVLDTEEKTKVISLGKKLNTNLTSNNALINADNNKIKKLSSTPSSCHACGHAIDISIYTSQIAELKEEIDARRKSNLIINKELDAMRKTLSEINIIEVNLKEKLRVENDIANLKASIDTNLSDTVLDEGQLKDSMCAILSSISKAKESINIISKENNQASAHNAKVTVIIEQLAKHREDIKEYSIKSTELTDTCNKVEIIKKAFGPSGLLSYKLEYLVKDLEKEINKYLGTLSDGKFQLVFKLEKEKLNVEIIDEGIGVSIEELSAGELARINAATLLAIRKLMAAISSTKINVLFLDEILGVLDEAGKEMLIEVLHSEKDLNTMLVSHQWSHPLIPKITVVKENKISRIEEF